jgi:hypothetical protein
MGPHARFPLGLLGIGLAGAMLAFAPPAAGNGSGGGEETGLPFSQGRSFDTLEAYLAHLEELGTIGITWYRRLPDGRYVEVQRRPPGQEPPVFTRHELLERFGFDE